MKFLHVTVHFEFADAIERILDAHGIRDFVRYPRVEGQDGAGKHFGSQVFPGNVAVTQAQVPEEQLDGVLEDLQRFRDAKEAHDHLEALVLPVERRL